MPALFRTLSLPDDTQVFFTDTGPHPATRDYTTVVIVHGAGFNARGFDVLHDYAHHEALRLVIVNRRHYPGSSAYTPREIGNLRDGEYIFEELSRYLARFLVAFIKSSRIQPVNDEGHGGLVVLGWSIGCSTVLSLLGAPSATSNENHAFLHPYLRNLILYDPPTCALGYESSAWPMDAYFPFSDPELNTTEALANGFREWVTSYYDTPPINWIGTIEALHPQQKYTDIMTTWSHERLKTLYTPESAVVADLPLLEPTMEPHARAIAHRCLYDETLTRTFFPDVHITYVSCGRSVWMCVWAAYESQRIYEEKVAAGKRVRKTHFLVNDKANHFFHDADPLGFLRTIKEGLRLGDNNYKAT